jgi:hypothetical protein
MQLIELKVQLRFDGPITANPTTPPWVVPVRFSKPFAGEPLELWAEVDLALRTSFRNRKQIVTQMILRDVGDLVDLEVGARFEILTGNAVVAFGVVQAWTEKVVDVNTEAAYGHARADVADEVGTEAIQLSVNSAVVAHSVPIGQSSEQEEDGVV